MSKIHVFKLNLECRYNVKAVFSWRRCPQTPTSNPLEWTNLICEGQRLVMEAIPVARCDIPAPHHYKRTGLDTYSDNNWDPLSGPGHCHHRLIPSQRGVAYIRSQNSTHVRPVLTHVLLHHSKFPINRIFHSQQLYSRTQNGKMYIYIVNEYFAMTYTTALCTPERSLLWLFNKSIELNLRICETQTFNRHYFYFI